MPPCLSEPSFSNNVAGTGPASFEEYTEMDVAFSRLHRFDALTHVLFLVLRSILFGVTALLCLMKRISL